MCLLINSATKPQPKIAEQDIVVYKLVHKLENGKFLTPFKKYEVILGETYEDFVETPYKIKSLDTTNYTSNWYRIDIGFHSFANKADAKFYRAPSFGITDTIFTKFLKIVKCIIPKGSTYYEGVFCTFRSYVSDKIHYLKEQEDVFDS